MINSQEQKLTGSDINIENQLKTVTAQLICPITHQIMQDPAVIETGHVFERSAIQAWFRRGNRTNPQTNKPLQTLIFFPCIRLKNIIKCLPTELLAIKKQTRDLEELLITIQRIWNQTPGEISHIKKQKKKVDQENKNLKRQIQAKQTQNMLLKCKNKQLEVKIYKNIQINKFKQDLTLTLDKVNNNIKLAQKQYQKYKNKIIERKRSNSQQKIRLSSNKNNVQLQIKTQFNPNTRQNSFGKMYRYQNDKIKIVSKTNQSYSIYGQSVQQLVVNQQKKQQSNKKQQNKYNFSKQNKKYQNCLSDLKQKNMFNQKQVIKQSKYKEFSPQNTKIDSKLNLGFYIPYTKQRIITQNNKQKLSNNHKNLSYELNQINPKKAKCLDSGKKVDKTNPQKNNTEIQKKKQALKNNYILESSNNAKPTKIQTKKS